MAAEKVDEAAEEVAAEARCAGVAVEEKEVAGAERGTMTGSPGTTELESRLKTREEAAARVTGELLRTMCPRRVRKQTPLSTPRARRKLPSRKSPRLPENSLLKSWRQSWPGKRVRKQTPLSTLRARRKLPSRKSPRLPENSLLKSWRQSW